MFTTWANCSRLPLLIRAVGFGDRQSINLDSSLLQKPIVASFRPRLDRRRLSNVTQARPPRLRVQRAYLGFQVVIDHTEDLQRQAFAFYISDGNQEVRISFWGPLILQAFLGISVCYCRSGRSGGMIAQVSESKLGQVARTSHLMTSGTGFTAYLGMYKFLCDCQCLEHHFQGNDYAQTTHLVAFADRQQVFPAELSNSFLTQKHRHGFLICSKVTSSSNDIKMKTSISCQTLQHHASTLSGSVLTYLST